MNYKIKIIPYDPKFKEFVKTLNIAWLKKYFYVEPIDEKVLSNPEEEILAKGGKIFFAQLNNQIVGTYSLLKNSENVFELSKMAVSEEFQGHNFGNIMLQHCLDFAKKSGFEKVFLFSNTKLKPAIHLYKKFGFIEVSLGDSVYKRSDIKMEKII